MRSHTFGRTIIMAAALLVLPSAALAQTGFGVRAGSFTPDGDHLKMDATTAFGAHMALGFIPVLKFQLGIEYMTGKADYTFAGGTASDRDFKNVGVYADVRYPISLIPLFPVKPVVGGGIDVNLMSYIDEDTFADAGMSATTDPASFTRTGYHLMAGLMFKAPVLPFTITAEYRMQSISVSDGTLTNNGVLLGLTFGF